ARPEIPPGISHNENLEFFASGGDEHRWLPYTKVRLYTNAFIVQGGKILLGYKKRGFGMGKYNGFGGKVEQGETPLQAAVRELEEESGVKAVLEHIGSLFFLSDDAEWASQIEIYRTDSYEGTITESDEMRPEWFSASPAELQVPAIPFSKMWETDVVWLPLLITKKKFADEPISRKRKILSSPINGGMVYILKTH
ncbi:NUDIX hydrolase domain-like protein, partial [Gymnopilus junonius]